MWLLADKVFNKLQAAVDQGREATLEQAVEVSALIGWTVDDIYSVSGNTGVINVVGVLTQEPDPFAAIFADSNTTYEAIIDAVKAAEEDPAVEEIIFAIDSPGGAFKGMLETMEVIKNASKPTRAQVTGTATSAAYGIAASTDTVEALSKTAQFGSVGVVADFRINADRVSLTNTGSPNKRPDPSTHVGQAIIRSELDAAFELFAEGIAAKRGISARSVAEAYGRGGTYFADQAFKMGMVDRLLYSAQNANSNTAHRRAPAPYAKKTDNQNAIEAETMDLKTLKEKHPELVSAIIAENKPAPIVAPTPAPATQANGDDAIAKERSRVNAHLHMGTESGDMKTAHEAIASGAEMTPEITAKYLMAASKKAAIDARGGDNVDLDAGDGKDADAEKDAKAAADIMSAARERLNLTA